MDKKRLLVNVKKCLDVMEKETIKGDIKGCLIWIREGKITEIETY